MAIEEDGKQVQVSYSNHNHAFTYFYSTFKDRCVVLSDAKDIVKVGKEVYSFINDFNFALLLDEDKHYFEKRLSELKYAVNTDVRLMELLNAGRVRELYVGESKEYIKYFYKYYVQYLEVLGDFAEKLTNTMMPNTNMQKKAVRYSNNQLFFEKLIEYKRLLLDRMAEFELKEYNFRVPINTLMTFFYAYSLFIVERDRLTIKKVLSQIIGIVTNDKVLDSIGSYPSGLSRSQLEEYVELEQELERALLFINKLINSSFSDYDILPKVNKKEYFDKTLI